MRVMNKQSIEVYKLLYTENFMHFRDFTLSRMTKEDIDDTNEILKEVNCTFDKCKEHGNLPTIGKVIILVSDLLVQTIESKLPDVKSFFLYSNSLHKDKEDIRSFLNQWEKNLPSNKVDFK